MTRDFRIYLPSFLSALAAIFFLLPPPAAAATLGFSSASATVNAGATFTEIISVSSPDQAMNAVSGTVSFPADLLQAISVSKANSVLSLWVQDPAFSNTDGTISFGGIAPNPGYTGSRGQVFSVQFRAKRTGTAALTFSSSSQVLANDGNGTNILTNSNLATIAITATQAPAYPSPTGVGLLAHITSSTHPDQTQWYAHPHAIFDWTNAQGVSAIRLGYDEEADGKPGVLYSEPISHKELDFDDGSWYFHVQEKSSGGWGPISSYRVQIDTAPPLPFAVMFPNGTTTQSGNAISAQFTAVDELSGIDHYRIAVDGKESTVSADEGSRPYAVVVPGDPGAHTLLVRAFDKAGNVTLADGTFSVAGGASPSSPYNFFAFGWLAINYLSLILVVLAILGTLLFGAWYIRVHFSAYRRRLNHRLGIAHAHVHKEFDNLKDALAEEIRMLEQTKSKRTLTREEERLVIRFRKLLDQSEETIEKDIDDLPR